MAYDYNTADITGAGGGESSATNNTLIYQVPSSPTSVSCVLKKLIIDNATGVNARFLFDLTSATIATAMGAIADIAVEVGAYQTVILTEEDFGCKYVTLGIVGQCDVGGTGSGAKVTAEVDVLSG